MRIKKQGIVLLAAATLATSAFADEAKREGVIVSRTANALNVRTQQGPLTVNLTPGTSIKMAAGLSRKTRLPRTLIPGLIIQVKGDQQGNTITAASIEYKDRDFRSAVATRAGTQQQFAQAAAERKDLRSAIIAGQEYEIRKEITVYFATGKSVIAPQYKTQLHDLAQQAPSFGNYRISVLGFADPTGNAAANEKLSLRRAVAVSDYLRQTGLIQPARVLSPSAMGEGTTAPDEAAPTSNDQARRVVVRVVTSKLASAPQQ